MLLSLRVNGTKMEGDLWVDNLEIDPWEDQKNEYFVKFVRLKGVIKHLKLTLSSSEDDKVLHSKIFILLLARFLM